MSHLAASHDGYGAATRALGSPRDIEYRVFGQVTGQLTRALREGAPFEELAVALDENARLWMLLAFDLAGPGNGLPEPLRVQLLNLAVFTRMHTQKVFRREADAAVLVDINTAVMRGLRGQPKAEASA
jgi:flagellar biosynthesis activator protein FlaF